MKEPTTNSDAKEAAAPITRRKNRRSLDSAAIVNSEVSITAVERLTRSGKHVPVDTKLLRKTKLNARSASVGSLDKRLTRASNISMSNTRGPCVRKNKTSQAVRKLSSKDTKEAATQNRLNHVETKRHKKQTTGNTVGGKEVRGSVASKRKSETPVAEAKHKLKRLRMSTQRAHLRSTSSIQSKPARAYGYRTRTKTS